MTHDSTRSAAAVAEDNKIHGEVVRDVGIFILKTLITLNSGAAIVLLTFTGSMMTNEKAKIRVDLDQMRIAMTFFLIGIGFALTAAAITYFMAQAQYGGWRAKTNCGRRALVWTIALPAFAGFFSFTVGFYMAAIAVTAQ